MHGATQARAPVITATTGTAVAGLKAAITADEGWRRYRKAGNPTKPAKNPTTKFDKSRGLANVPEMNMNVKSTKNAG